MNAIRSCDYNVAIYNYRTVHILYCFRAYDKVYRGSVFCPANELAPVSLCPSARLQGCGAVQFVVLKPEKELAWIPSGISNGFLERQFSICE